MITMSSVDPNQNRFRDYSIDIQEGLFGTWTVFVHWGRKRSSGQNKEYLYQTFMEAERKVKQIIKIRLRHRYQLISISSFFEGLGLG